MFRISSSDSPPFYSCSEEWIYPVELKASPRAFHMEDLEEEVERANRRCEDLSLRISKIKRLYEKHLTSQEVQIENSYHEVPNFIPLDQVEQEAKVEAHLSNTNAVGGVGAGEAWWPVRGRKKKSAEKRQARLYLQPTHSSALKTRRETQPARHQFNFRSIPFVAGMSTTGSHNLGLKIQETLSLIKMTKNAASQPHIHGHQGGEWVKRECRDVEEGDMGYTSGQQQFDKDQLRAVLVHLQHEYSSLLREYEEAREGHRYHGDESRLRMLEAHLDTKEKVINVISSLYKQFPADR